MSYGDVMAGAYCRMPIGAYCRTPTSAPPHHSGHVAAASFQPGVSDGLWIAFALGVLVLALIAVQGLVGWLDRRRARRRWA